MEKKKIMIVDDSSTMRLILRNMLFKDPNLVVVKAATNGKEALEALSQTPVDLILLDLEMPEMGGLEFLRHARLRTRAKIVVLSSTTFEDSQVTVEARNLGADAVLSKPSGSVSYDLEEKRGDEFWKVIYLMLGLERKK